MHHDISPVRFRIADALLLAIRYACFPILLMPLVPALWVTDLTPVNVVTLFCWLAAATLLFERMQLPVLRVADKLWEPCTDSRSPSPHIDSVECALNSIPMPLREEVAKHLIVVVHQALYPDGAWLRRIRRGGAQLTCIFITRSLVSRVYGRELASIFVHEHAHYAHADVYHTVTARYAHYVGVAAWCAALPWLVGLQNHVALTFVLAVVSGAGYQIVGTYVVALLQRTQEHRADLVAARAFGPALVYATMVVVGRSPTETTLSTHPSLRSTFRLFRFIAPHVWR